MIKISTCEHCSASFKYNNKDSKGKFCSQRCHYDSKNERIICIQCGYGFIKRKKDMRKTCSTECFKTRRMKTKRSRTPDPKVPEPPVSVTPEPEIEAKTEVKVKPLFTTILDKIKELFGSISR